MEPFSESLLITGLVTIVYQLIFYCFAAYYKMDKVTDLAGGTNFVVIAVIIFAKMAAPNPSVRQSVITALVLIWGCRLSAFLFYRILAFQTDSRFDGTRENSLKFLVFWIFQMLWVWIVSLPVTYLNSSDPSDKSYLNIGDYIGITMAGIGFISETWADQTKLYYKMKNGSSSRWCDWGLWKFSRHPNYFGELFFWWGIFISCSQSFSETFAYVTIISPCFITYLLLGLSGMPILEETTNKKFGRDQAYRTYRNCTSILIPLPNFLYGSLPKPIKFLLLEWDIYGRGMPSDAELTNDILVNSAWHYPVRHENYVDY